MNVTKFLQEEIRSAINIAYFFVHESPLIEQVYYDTGVSTTISAKANGDQVSVSTKISKLEMLNGITMMGQINKLFQNQIVTQGDYLSTCNSLMWGTATGLASQIDDAVEEVANRLKFVASNCISLWNLSKGIASFYNSNEISDIVAVLQNERIIYGSEMSKSDLSSAIAFLSQWDNLISNIAVTQGDYQSSISKLRIY